jgi:hypothetical protein
MEFHDQRNEGYSLESIIDLLERNHYKVVKYKYDIDSSGKNLKFGKIVATRLD